ncbi:MAG: nucleotidyltransferase family protein [Chthoniobacterales bacterium]
MKAGILAAGRGERLRSASHPLKPLVEVGGRTLLEHVLHSLGQADVTEVTVLINEDSLAVRDCISAANWPFPVRWVIETTPSSMHTFLRLVETLSADGDEEPFLLSTVDTIAGAQTYARFLKAALSKIAADVSLALTSPGDDETPLLVSLSPNDSRVIALGAAAAPWGLATAGIYLVRASILREAEEARNDGLDALRIFLGRLLERGYRIDGIPIEGAIDVDRPGDIETAEAFLRSAKS